MNIQTKHLVKYPDELAHCHKIHPKAFIEGTEEHTMRLDFNLIWSVYEDEINDVEMFAYRCFW